MTAKLSARTGTDAEKDAVTLVVDNPPPVPDPEKISIILEGKSLGKLPYHKSSDGRLLIPLGEEHLKWSQIPAGDTAAIELPELDNLRDEAVRWPPRKLPETHLNITRPVRVKGPLPTGHIAPAAPLQPSITNGTNGGLNSAASLNVPYSRSAVPSQPLLKRPFFRRAGFWGWSIPFVLFLLLLLALWRCQHTLPVAGLSGGANTAAVRAVGSANQGGALLPNANPGDTDGTGTNSRVATGSLAGLSVMEIITRKPPVSNLTREGEARFQNDHPDDGILLLEEAAKRGDSQAMLDLGQAYDPNHFIKNGPIPKPDFRQAARYYKEAADTGDSRAVPLRTALESSLKEAADKGDEAARLTLKDFWP